MWQVGYIRGGTTMNLCIVIVVFLPMVGAFLSYLIGRYHKTLRDYFADMIVVIEFAVMVYLFAGSHTGLDFVIPDICGFGLHFTMDGFRLLYCTIAAFMWMMTTLFSREYFTHYRNRNRYYFFMLITLGATMGVFLSSDFYTTFIFFEIMSLTSYVWVAHDEKPDSLRAAATYLAVAVIGGLVMLMGIFLLYDAVGTLEFTQLVGAYEQIGGLDPQKMNQVWIAGICLLFGFGAKAGAFPLHIWLPKAHPVAPAPASALLSGILTKAGMFGILIISNDIFAGTITWATLILLLGVMTMVIGAILAVFSVDIKRVLACSSVSQIGFILVGVGMNGLLNGVEGIAARGALLHMVNHSLIKLVLFMAAGVIFMNLHQLELNQIRGFGRNKPLFHFIFLMGALGIAGVPLWNGYISKTLIHESIVLYTELLKQGVLSAGLLGAGAMRAIEWIFLCSGGLTVAYMLKLYIAVFVEKNEDSALQAKYDALKGHYMNKVSAFALTGSAVVLPILGFFPQTITGRLADMGQEFLQLSGEEEAFSYFSLTNLKGGFISLGIGALVYLAVVRTLLMQKKESGMRQYVNRWPQMLDLENLVYRPVLLQILPFLLGVICRILDSLTDTIVVVLRKTIYRDSRLPHELAEGTGLTHAIGVSLNQLEKCANMLFWRKKKRNVDFEHKLVVRYNEWMEDSTIISRSMSFGLLIFCMGLTITLVYLLVWG